jgi:16S rRNA (guanine527-N7)-methyltransferase
LDSEALDAFEAFECALYERNTIMNLTRVPQEECWIRHFLDSLLFHDLCPSGSVLDLGSGPGFPAWPLARARPDLQLTAMDSSSKMLGFLRTQPLPNLEIIQGRAEELDLRNQFDFVTGRAVAPFAIQMELSAGMAKVGGHVIPLRVPSDPSHIESFPFEKLGLKLEHIEARTLPVLDAPRIVPICLKVGHTPREYPRPWAEMKRRPLKG